MITQSTTVGRRAPGQTPASDEATPRALASLSLVVPLYNEASRLPATLDALKAFLARLDRSVELIFVDDGSADATVRILEEHAGALDYRLVTLPTNSGKGWAVRSGILTARGTCVAFLDADLATPPGELLRLVQALDQGADVAIGSRVGHDGTDLRRTGPNPQSRARQALGRLFWLVATRPFLGDVRDSQCGAKAFTSSAASRIFAAQRTRRWVFDIEVLYLARRMGMAIVEVPVDWSAKSNSKLNPSPRMAMMVLAELLKVVWVHRGA